MAKIWKISDAASIGLHAAVLLATTGDRLVRTREIADLLQVSEAHLSKVLQRMAKSGLVRAVRGPTGGFALDGDPDRVTLLQVYESIEGPLLPVNCLLDKPICDGTKCIMGGLITQVNRGVREYLEQTRLSQLVGVYDGVSLGGKAPAGPGSRKSAVRRKSRPRS